MAKRTLRLSYGKGDVSFDLPAAHLLCEVKGCNHPPLENLREAYLAALDHPVDSAPLREMVTPGGTVAIPLKVHGEMIGVAGFRREEAGSWSA